MQLKIAIITCTNFQFIYGVLRVWNHNADITNPNNWMQSKRDVDDCTGTHFSEENSAPIFIDTLYTSQLVLPLTGELVILNSVQFTEHSKCIRVKSMNFGDWYDYRNWDQPQKTLSPAVPHTEYVPCTWDSVELPAGIKSALSSDQYDDTHVAGVTFTGPDKKMPVSDYIQVSPAARDTFRRIGRAEPFNIIADGGVGQGLESCEQKQPGECACHGDRFIQCPIRDEVIDDSSTFGCTDLVTPLGFCKPICGAYLNVKLNNEDDPTKLETLRQQVSQYKSETHISKTYNHFGEQVIQVVFAEKDEFMGQSVRDADDLYTKLSKSPREITNVAFFKSGDPFGDSKAESIVVVIFGTLALVLFVFALIFYTFNSNVARYNFGTIHLFDGMKFARFDDGRETVSVVNEASDINVDDDNGGAFDNPLYHRNSVEEVDDEHKDDTNEASQNVRETWRHVQHVNPMYDVELEQKGAEMKIDS